MEEFKQYYKFPLKPMLGLETIKVLTADDKMAFDWCVDLEPKDRNKYLDIINSNSDNYKWHCNWEYVNGFIRTPFVNLDGSGIIYKNLLHIRGWGMLTDHPYHLPEEEAKRIQDEFGEYICNQLNS